MYQGKIQLESVTLDIGGVEKLMCLMAARLTTDPLIALMNDRVQMALAERLCLVLIIESLCA